jgi:hypothetical protein
MMTDTHLERHAAPPSEDARDLLARLCRELGVCAVATELQVAETLAYELDEAPEAMELQQPAIAA